MRASWRAVFVAALLCLSGVAWGGGALSGAAALGVNAAAGGPGVDAAGAGDDVLPEVEAAYERGLEAYEAGVAGASGGVVSRGFLDEAGARFAEAASLLYARGRVSADVEAAAGNAALLGGDAGSAVLRFRRALLADPDHAGAAAGLRAARALVEAAPEAGLRSSARDATDAAIGVFGRDALFWAAAGGHAVFWLALGWGVWRRVMGCGFGVGWVVAAAAVVCVSAGGVLMAHAVLAEPGEAVVLQQEVVARTGPSEAVYPAAFDGPLAAGVEGVVVNERAGWAQVRTADGTVSWVPVGLVVAVDPLVE